MKFPLEDVLCIVVGYLVTAIIGYAFSRLVKKCNWNLGRIIGKLPSWIGGLLGLILILLVAPFACVCLTWAFTAYKYFKSGDLALAASTFAINVLGCFYISLVTEGLSKRCR